MPGNFLRIIVANMLTKVGDLLTSPKTVLAWLIVAVGAPASLGGLLVPIRESGALIPQLVIGAWVRRYPVRADRDFDQMEVDGTIFETGLFIPEKTYATTFIKTRDELVMEIKGDGKSLYHHWDISTVEPTEDGPFGIRQMWQKHAVYKNIKIFTKS